jgi:carboxylesterase type B
MFETIMAFSGGGTPAFRVAMEGQFRCAASGSAKGRVTAEVPVYRYIFANNKPGSTKGATHGDEVSFVFGDGKPGFTDVFQPLWAKFVKDPVNGLVTVPWPKYSPNGMYLISYCADES